MFSTFLFLGLSLNVLLLSEAENTHFLAKNKTTQRFQIGSENQNPRLVKNDTLQDFFYYVSSANRIYRRFGSKSYQIVVYRLPEKYYKILKKQEARKLKKIVRAKDKIERLLHPFYQEREVLTVSDEGKYRQFYPGGLRSGDCIGVSEFRNWDFVEHENEEVSNPLLCLKLSNDTLNFNSYLDSVKMLAEILQGNMAERGAEKFHFFDVRKPQYENPYRNPLISEFDSLLPILMKNLYRYSPLLGAQRIRLELFDNPVLAAYYSELYTHYVDSLFNILKTNFQIKPGESERFIQAVSSIIPARFPYSVNYLLWEGMSKNKLDCDNTAYLVFDIGRKLGMDVSIVLVRLHAVAIVGDFVYETTCQQYYHKSDLRSIYPNVFLVSSNNDSINIMAAIYEISLFLEENGEIQKAKVFAAAALKVFPDDPQLEQSMGDIYSCEGNYENAFEYYTKASQKLPDDWLLLFRCVSAKSSLLSSGKEDVVFSIINKYQNKNEETTND